MRRMMAFIDASLGRRHRAAVLVHLPRRIVEDTGQRGAEHIVVVSVVMVLLKRRHKFSNRWQRTRDRRRLRSYVEALH